MRTYFEYQAAVFADANLDSKEKLVALAIASHFNWAELNPAFPTNNLLCKETGFGESTVIRAKKGLIAKGYLTVKQRFDSSSLYTPTLPTVTVTGGSHTDTPSPLETEGGVVTQTPGGSHSDYRGVSQRQPNREVNNEVNREAKRQETEEPNLSLVKNEEEPGEVKELEEVVELTDPSLVEDLEDVSVVEEPSLEEQKTEDAVDHGNEVETASLSALLDAKGLSGSMKDKVQRELELSYDPMGAWEKFNDDNFHKGIINDHHARARWATIMADGNWEKQNGKPAVEW